MYRGVEDSILEGNTEAEKAGFGKVTSIAIQYVELIDYREPLYEVALPLKHLL